jgi:hypothetical protein
MCVSGFYCSDRHNLVIKPMRLNRPACPNTLDLRQQAY